MTGKNLFCEKSLKKDKIHYCFISGNVPSSKNSKISTSRGVFHSKTVKNYLRSKGIKAYSTIGFREKKDPIERMNDKRLFMHNRKVEVYKTITNTLNLEIEPIRQVLERIKSKPIKIYFYFVRDSRRKWDFINIVQIILDLMTAHELISDDNVDEVIPVYIGYEVDKKNAGVYIFVEGD